MNLEKAKQVLINEGYEITEAHDWEVPESYFESVFDAISVEIGDEFESFVSSNKDDIDDYIFNGYQQGTSPSEVADFILDDLFWA